ncbi:amino acid adenylation domain-containing protein [Streptomyces sp. NBC_00525]|uniref:amino acid adenylation domain-containing protein n=1 Tax=Streptomyces sp. NBC_00525 TaxID=2903660 RepID=UPI002E81A57E|nr:amino acid adenylation domain-containing protein [Streptomyces sp. NBC_00525]WUC96548.1 amino acid adenylation domain-containing protein [Streptomyces sp. NBC_00525]
MNHDDLLTALGARGVQLRREGDALKVRGPALAPEEIEALRRHKPALLARLAEECGEDSGTTWWTPPRRITPKMLPLVTLDQRDVDAVVATVEGGADNVQDIYPLAPLQEGVLFHHLLSSDADPYLMTLAFSFDSRARLDAFLAALRKVVDRHDILRTAVVWEGPPEPVQVVWRHAALPVTEADVTGADDRSARLRAMTDARGLRLDLTRPPLAGVVIAPDAPGTEGWLAVLLWHHLIADHVTLEVVLQEVGAHLEGPEPDLPEPVPFREFVARVRAEAGERDHERFFTGMLGDVTEPTAPYGASLATGDGTDVTEARRRVDERVAARLRERAGHLGVSTAALCHLAWAHVLARLTGRDDVVFGTVLAGRLGGGDGSDRAVGPFINTLPVRVDTGAPPGAVHDTLTALLAHEHASAALAQRCAAVPAPAPLFTTLLNYRHSLPAQGPQWHGIELLDGEERTNYPLTLSVDDLGTGLGLTVQAAAPLDPERVCAYVHTALSAVAEGTPGPVDVLPPQEHEALIHTYNRTAAPLPDLLVHEQIAEHARRTPDAVAVVHAETTLTYAELDAHANRLAQRLRALGVRPDDRVGVRLPRGTGLAVALLGILKAGGGYLPLDLSYPAARLAHMIEDAAPVVVVDEELLDATARTGPAPAPGRDGLAPHHLAYVIYTSGSTGRPKGVEVEHAQLLHSTHARALAYPRARRFLLLSSLSFDSSVAGVFGTLARGGTLVIASEPRDPRATAREITRHRVDTLLCVPSLYSALLDELTGPGAPGDCPLTTAVLAGEVCPPELVTDSAARLPGTTLVNEYGPTEACVWATAHTCRPDEEGPVPIGTPVANARVYVLDGRDRPVPDGVTGELVIGGAGVARGYLGMPTQTAERFGPDPFLPGGRVYRTGDLARRRPDGTLEFLGRRDQQVKLRGHRIEPAETEAILAPHVTACAVAVRDGVLVGYVVGGPPVARLRELAAEQLPAPLVPTAWVALDALPLTPNGKLDRAALPRPHHDDLMSGAHAPQGEAETVVAAIWADLLGVEGVGRHADFFELGGHSLTAVRVTSRVRAALGADTSVTALFDAPVLADYVHALTAPTSRPAPPPLTPAPRDQTPVPSSGQRRLWLLSQVDGADRAHRVRTALRLRGTLDEPALRRALDTIVARHDVLRTVFTEGGTPHPIPARFAWTDDLEAPFDLARGPLLRGHLTRTRPDEWELRLAAHHIVSDGWSAGLLIRELGALYRAFTAGEPDPLPALPVQYADYAAWQQSLDLDEQAAYWQHTLDGAPHLTELPTDRPRPARQDFAGEFADCTLDAELTRKLTDFSRRHGCTLFVTLLAAWGATLTRLSGESEIVIGTPTAGRGRPETDSLIGFFVNMLPLRLDTTGDPTVTDWIDRVRQQVTRAQANQDLPFERIVELLDPARSPAHTPLFQTAFTWQADRPATLDLPGITVEPLDTGPHRSATYDLTLALGQADGRIHGGIEYATALFDRDTVDRYLGHWRTLLSALADDDRSPLSRLPMLTPPERDRLIQNSAGPRHDHEPACLHELFDAQARRTPQAAALVHGTHRLTYGELDAYADRIAGRLRSLGVGPDDRVGIRTDPGAGLVAAVLGVLKAGGAYLPLDPHAPADRLHALTEAARPVTVLDTDTLDALAGPGTPEAVREHSGVRPDHLAYVMPTSGSTGEPKLVMVEHRAIVASTRARAAVHGPAGRCVLAVPLGFDAAAAALFGTLTTGGTLIVADRDLAELPALLSEQRVETLVCATSALLTVLPVLDAPALRRVVVGGDPCPPGLADDLARRHPDAVLVNEYGPTEATVWVTHHRCHRGEAAVPVGQPVENMRVYVLDTHDEPVPPGVTGEVCIAGTQLARGYLDRPDLTAERFVTDPFTGDRMYRTGDLGRRRGDGDLELLGRADDQIKIRGIRIEPGEIETRLREHPRCDRAVVLARAGTLVAYHTGPATPDELRAHLARTLPDYLLPGAYVALPALPLTGNGKADRAALPDPAPEAYVRHTYEPPAGPVETALAEAWAELLGQERVGRGDNFFDLGGHSLLAVTLVHRLRARGLALTLTAVLGEPSLRDLAATVTDLPSATAAAPGPDPAELAAVADLVTGGADNIHDLYPLTPLQEGILFHHLLAAEEEAEDPYLTTLVFRLASRARADATVAALQQVIDRHEILRTGVVWENLPGPRQVVWRRAALPVTETTADRISDARRIDVRRAPLLRADLAPAADEGEAWLLALHLHHLVGDHATLETVFAETQVLLRGDGPDLPEPRPFRTFVDRVTATAAPAAAEEFFTALLGDVEEPTAPYGVLAGEPGVRVDEHRMELDPATAERLRARARRHSVGPAALWHLAWALVLARLTGRDDVVFGTVLLGRSAAEPGAIGPFINTLPIRVTVDDTDVPAALRSTQRLLAELLRHEHASLADAQRRSAVPAPTPLFTSLLNYRHQDAPAAAAQPADTALPVAAVDRTNYPLTVSVDASPGSFATTVQSMGGIDPIRVTAYLHTAVTGILAALDEPEPAALHTIDVLPETEVAAPEEGVGEAVSECVHELFEAWVAKAPDAVAVIDGEVRVSYGELNARANRVAHGLIGSGVGRGDLVAVRMERGADLVAVLLGVWKAGAAYVPVDPAYPVERQDLLLGDCSPVAVVESVPASGMESNPAVEVGPGDVAYVIYTSGSTGRPKGVLVEHRNVVRLFSAAGEWCGAGVGDVWSFFHSFAFDFSVWEVFGALTSGGSVLVVPGEVARSAEEFHGLVCRAGVTVLSQTPSAFAQFLAVREADALPHALRYVVFGGEALEPAVLRPWFENESRESGVTLLNMYGVTEVTVHVTARVITAEDVGAPVSPIGVPLSDLRAYVLDSRMRPVPVGVTGELFVGGAGVARGYLNRPELTGVRFLDDPFLSGGRMYRTGDLVRCTSSGELEFVGRNDAQVKVRGYRIEPGEVETALLGCPGIREAVVIARDDTLVAYVVGGNARVEELRNLLAERLPSHLVPAAFVCLEAFPLTVNGKLDRAALPAPDGTSFARGVYEAPRGEAERVLAEIWSELLGVERVGRNDSFFDLGGHSLLAVQVLSRIRARLGAAPSLQALFAYPALTDCARAAIEARAAGQGALPPIVPVPRAGGTAPMSFAQSRLWFLAKLDGVSEAYHIPLRLRLEGELDEDALRRALDTIVARHEVLRTTFAQDRDGHAVQVCAETGHFTWLDAEDEGAPFDLTRGPLIRGHLARTGPHSWTLSITMHHIVSDGWSIGVLVSELNTLYEAFRDGRPDPLSPLPVQYADYALWQQERMSGEGMKRQAEFWRRTLEGAPERSELPTDRPRPAHQDFTGAAVERVLDAELTSRLKDLAARHDTTLYATVLAGWAALLTRLGEHPEAVIGTPVANRGQRETEGLIGFFANMLPLRFDASDDPGLAEWLARTKAVALAAQDHQDLPFEQLVEVVQPRRSLAHNAVFQIAFAWQADTGSRLALPGVTASPLTGPEHTTARFDLTLSVTEGDDGCLHTAAEYATALFDRVTVERFLGHWTTLLHAMTEAADTTPIGRLSVLTDVEQDVIVHGWNDTAADFPTACLHELFEAQAARSPQAVAVVADEELTYAALDARANGVAHRLHALGVRPGDRVAVALRRGADMVAAVLGVLKAGGAYVPLDPDHPAERLRTVIDSCDPVAVITRTPDGHPRGPGGHPGPDGPPAPGWAPGRPVVTVPPDGPATGPDVTALTPADLAYIVYTSGSTGTPKGVMTSHEAACNTLQDINTRHRVGPEDAVLAVSSLSFDLSVYDIFGVLAAGGRVVVPPPGPIPDPAAWHTLVAEHGVTLWDSVPALAQLFVDSAPAGASFPSVRLVMMSGDWIPVDLPERIHARCPRASIHSYGGATEAAIWSVSHPIDPAVRHRGSVPYGSPLANQSVYVLDDHGRPCPQGVAGDLYIGGAGVALGYHGLPDLTAERFPTDPFRPGGRMYATGDRARWKTPGVLEFLGRSDFQVKIRGFRIELGDIESRLLAHPGVREAVVLAREDTPGDRRLVAYTVGPASSAELRAHLASGLPDYMVPTAHVALEAIPLTANGKLDRRALPAPEGTPDGDRPRTPPLGEAETAIAEIWADLLGVADPGREDNFFELGGHSLLAVTLLDRMRSRGLETDVRAVFTAPTLAALAELSHDIQEIRL